MCGFCKNLGFSLQVCQSHNVRNCPELANTQCRYCHEFGHTVKQCPKLKTKKICEVIKQPVKVVVEKPVIINSFAHFQDNCDMPSSVNSKSIDNYLDSKTLGVWGKKSGIDVLQMPPPQAPAQAQAQAQAQATAVPQAQAQATAVPQAQAQAPAAVPQAVMEDEEHDDSIWDEPCIGCWADEE